MGTRWGSGPTGAPSKGTRGASAIALATDPRGEPFFLDDAPVRRGLAMSAAAPAPCLACISRHHGQHSCSRRRSFATPSPVVRPARQRISPAAASAAATSTSPRPTPERRAAGRAVVRPSARRNQAAAQARMSVVAARRAAAVQQPAATGAAAAGLAPGATLAAAHAVLAGERARTEPTSAPGAPEPLAATTSVDAARRAATTQQPAATGSGAAAGQAAGAALAAAHAGLAGKRARTEPTSASDVPEPLALATSAPSDGARGTLVRLLASFLHARITILSVCKDADKAF